MAARQLTTVLAAAFVLISLAASALAGSTSTEIVPRLNKDGLSARDNRNFGAVPDTSGAIGRGHYLEAVIPRIALFDRKTLRLVAARDAYAFWRRSNVSQIVDPHVVWDSLARRWYYVALFNGSGGANNQLLFAWTKRGRTTNLSDAWCRMSIRTGKLFPDFPKLGFGRNHILIGTNMFNVDADPPEFLSARIWVIGKPRSGRKTCARLRVTSFGSEADPLRRADGNLAFTPVPVDPARPRSRAYVVAADCVFEPQGDEEPPPCGTPDRQANQITVWHVDGPRGSPRLTRDGGVDVPVYRLPSPAPQRGTRTTVDTSDTRFYQAVSAPDPTRRLREAIWTQHTVDGPGRRSELRWYELDPQRLSVVRRGTVRDARDWTFSGAISPTARGNRAVVHYIVSGPDRLPQLRARSRGPRTPNGVMGGELTLARSAAPLVGDKCGADSGEPCAWGDYAQATPDPRRPRVVWGSNELVGSPKHAGPLGTYWRTRNFALAAGRARR
jgi:hypothetical protein